MEYIIYTAESMASMFDPIKIQIYHCLQDIVIGPTAWLGLQVRLVVMAVHHKGSHWDYTVDFSQAFQVDAISCLAEAS